MGSTVQVLDQLDQQWSTYDNDGWANGDRNYENGTAGEFQKYVYFC